MSYEDGSYTSILGEFILDGFVLKLLGVIQSECCTKFNTFSAFQTVESCRFRFHWNQSNLI